MAPMHFGICVKNANRKAAQYVWGEKPPLKYIFANLWIKLIIGNLSNVVKMSKRGVQYERKAALKRGLLRTLERHDN